MDSQCVRKHINVFGWVWHFKINYDHIYKFFQTVHFIRKCNWHTYNTQKYGLNSLSLLLFISFRERKSHM